MPDKRADEISNILEKTWFSRYPWPQEVIMDRGTDFAKEVKDLLAKEYGIKRKPITTRNPQANAMVERAHKTLHNMIRVHGIKDKRDLPDSADPWGGILAAVAFGMRTTMHTTSKASPSQLVFNRDAIHNVRFLADW